MKKTKYLNKILIGIMGTLGLGGAAVGGGILAYTNANVDQLESLTRAVRDNTVEQYKAKAHGDVIVALGGNHSAAIIDGKLYTWGANIEGQLGLGDTKERHIPTEVKNMSSNGNNTTPIGTVTQIWLGGLHSAAIINGKLHMWGYNLYGQLGLGGRGNELIPTEVKNMSDGIDTTPIGNITQIWLGGFHSAAIINGKLHMWGYNDSGQLGLGDDINKYIPTEVKNMSNGTNTTPIGTITQISLGGQHSAAIINGKLYMWGYNSTGQLGLGDTKKRLIPTEVKNMSDGTNTIPIGTITQISLGDRHSAAIINGKLYMWGYNTTGQLGLGDNRQRNIPTEVKNMSDGTNAIPVGTATQISLGGLDADHSAAIINGKLYMWGQNDDGQLGLGDTTQRNIPTEVKNMSDGTNPTPIGTVNQMSLGGQNSVAIIEKKVYIWGRNAEGQLGLGDTTQRNIPTPVVALDKDKDITLDASNDPTNLKDDIVYNINETELKSLINRSKATIGIERADTYTITNRNNIATLDAIKKGQISVEVNTTPSDKNIKVKFRGFKPSNETQSIAGITKTIIGAPSGEINDLVAKANDDTTGMTSILARWIIDTDNRTQIIGDVTTKYTENFPLNTRIKKVSDFTVLDGTTGQISFKIEVDKYYKLSGTDLIESVASDRPITLTNKITLSGFNKSRMSAISVIPTSIRNFTAKELLDFFGYVNETTAITGLAGLKKYLTDLDNFPIDTAFKIVDKTVTTDPNTKKVTLAFRIVVDKYFDNSGIQVNQTRTFNTAKLEINGLNNPTSSISWNGINGPNTVNANDLLKSFGGVDTNITPEQKTALEQYLDFSNFPMDTKFQITNAVKNDTTLTFKVSADKHVDVSGTEIPGKTLFPGTGANDIFTINGLKDSSTKQPVLISPNSLLNPTEILEDMGYTQINSTSGRVTKVGLEQYFTNIDTFPTNATYELRNLVKTTATLEFKIYASIYLGAFGTELQNFTSTITYKITGSLNPSTTVRKVNGHRIDILSGDLWDSFNVHQNGTYNAALTNPYFQIHDGVAGATYTMQEVSRSPGKLSLNIIASSHKLNGVDIPTPQTYPVMITGLISTENSSDIEFQKDIISGDGALISQQIETQIIAGNTINSNNPLLQEIVNTAAYPPNTTFTIDVVKPVDKVIFKTFSIRLTANKVYDNQTTASGTQSRTLNIDNLKFSPTKWTRMAQALPDIKNEQFLAYVNYDDVNGTFDHAKLREFFILENFDLTTPNATRMTNARIENNEIKFSLAVTHYVDPNGIGQNKPTTYDLSINLNNSAGALPGAGTDADTGTDDKTTETIIIATSIAGAVLLLLLPLSVFLIRRKRRMG